MGARRALGSTMEAEYRSTDEVPEQRGRPVSPSAVESLETAWEQSALLTASMADKPRCAQLNVAQRPGTAACRSGP